MIILMEGGGGGRGGGEGLTLVSDHSITAGHEAITARPRYTKHGRTCLRILSLPVTAPSLELRLQLTGRWGTVRSGLQLPEGGVRLCVLASGSCGAVRSFLGEWQK